MQKLFDVRQIWSLADDENVDDIDVLVLAHAAGLNDKELYAIDQYLMRGGKALIFVDPYNERSEEHTSELLSLMRISYDGFCLKKKKPTIYQDSHTVHIE